MCELFQESASIEYILYFKLHNSYANNLWGGTLCWGRARHRHTAQPVIKKLKKQ